MLQFDNDSEHSDGSCFRRILHKALPMLGKTEPRYGNRSINANRFEHPLNRLPKRKKKRKRQKKRIPLNVLSNPTVIYCTCANHSLTSSNLVVRKPCPSLPLSSLRICLSEGQKFVSEPRRTVKSVLRVKETHEIAEAQLRKNEKLRHAFGISEYFVEGSSFDPERHSKETAAKAAIEDTKKYALIPSPPSSEDESAAAEKPAELSKSKKKKKVSASPSAPATTKKKKKKKHKRKSASPSDEEKVSSHKSKSEKEVKKQRHVSPSPTKTSKHRKRNDCSDRSDIEMKKNKKKKLEKHHEERSHKSRTSRSPSPYRSDIESTDGYESSKKKKKQSRSMKFDEKKKRSPSRGKARQQEKDSPLTSEYERQKKRSTSRGKCRKGDDDSSSTSDSSIERSPKIGRKGDVKKRSRNKSKEKRSRNEKADAKKRHRSKRKSSSIESYRDGRRETKMSDKSNKISGGGRGKKSTPEQKRKRHSSSVERQKSEHKFAPPSSSKRKHRDSSSSEAEFADRRMRRGDSREKAAARERDPPRDTYAKQPFYGKKTRLTVSDSESGRSSRSPDTAKFKSKSVRTSNKVDADTRYGSTGTTRSKNRFTSKRDSKSDPSSSEEDSRLVRESRRLLADKVRTDVSKPFKGYSASDKTKPGRSDGDKNRSEGVKESPKSDGNKTDAVLRITTPCKSNEYRSSSKAVSDTQRNGVESAPVAENGTTSAADGKVGNRDSSTSSSLSYSPMEKYPHRYKDILSDVSRKKSDSNVRRFEMKTSPAKNEERFGKENLAEPLDVEKRVPSATSLSSSRYAAPAAHESKSGDSFCVSDVPLPPESGSSSAKLTSKKDADADDVSSPKKSAAKVNDSTSALVKSIPPSLSQKPNTLASSISEVITKSMRKRDRSTSSSDSLPNRKSRSSSRSSSSSDSSRSSRKRSNSSSSLSSRSSSDNSTRRRRKKSRKSSSSDRSSSSSSSDSSRSNSPGRSTVKSKKKKKRTRSRSNSNSRSYSSSYSSSRSRSISIPRRKGSPSFLERRRITSRKRKRRSPYSSSSSSRSSSSHSSSSSSS